MCECIKNAQQTTTRHAMHLIITQNAKKISLRASTVISSLSSAIIIPT